MLSGSGIRHNQLGTYWSNIMTGSTQHVETLGIEEQFMLVVYMEYKKTRAVSIAKLTSVLASH